MKSKIIGKKQILAFTLVGSLALAVFVNWYYTNPKNSESNKPQVTENINLGDAQYVNSDNVSNDYFSTASLNRQKAHDEAIENLKSIIADSSVDEDTKSVSRERLAKLSESIKCEADIENLISAQTGQKCIVTVDDNSIEVIMPKETINEETLIKIKDIVVSKSDIKPENITVIELK